MMPSALGLSFRQGPIIHIVRIRMVQHSGAQNLNCNSESWGRTWPFRRDEVRVQIAAVPLGRPIRA